MARWLKTVVFTLAVSTLAFPAFAQQRDQVKAQLHSGSCAGTCDGTKQQLRLRDGSGAGAQLRKQLRTENKQLRQAHGGGGGAYRGGK